MSGDAPARPADISFYFDPVCPFAWITSRWVRTVAAQRDFLVDWRFISLRMINARVDYDTHFPSGYEAGHTSGLRLLRVAARARAEHGSGAVGPLYEAISSEIFDSARAAGCPAYAQALGQVGGDRDDLVTGSGCPRDQRHGVVPGGDGGVGHHCGAACHGD